MSTAPDGITPHILPGILRDIARLASVDAAMAVCALARGGRLYIPRPDGLPGTHPLVKALGKRGALALARAMGGESYSVPTARPILRAYRARILRRAGYSVTQVAAILDMDRSHVLRLAPATLCPPGTVPRRVVRAIMADAPQRFARLKPGKAEPLPPPQAPAPLPLFDAAGVVLPR